MEEKTARDKLLQELAAAFEEYIDSDDPVQRQFLEFLSRDIADHPENLQAIDAGWVQRIQSLTGVIEVDLDAPLSAEDE